MAADLTLNEQESLINNCLCGFHPDLARRRFPAPFRGVSESVQGQEGGLAGPGEHLGAQWVWPTGRALFTADPTHVKETRAVYFMVVVFSQAIPWSKVPFPIVCFSTKVFIFIWAINLF